MARVPRVSPTDNKILLGLGSLFHALQACSPTFTSTARTRSRRWLSQLLILRTQLSDIGSPDMLLLLLDNRLGFLSRARHDGNMRWSVVMCSLRTISRLPHSVSQAYGPCPRQCQRCGMCFAVRCPLRDNPLMRKAYLFKSGTYRVLVCLPSITPL